ncbi:MAG: RluA family pseudouridine synthase [Rickettsiales bacterium]|jgi:23S rRNA pseudouridine955/2504/2580 synthase|nr:RluA family pseudouridine synthase [Rickettsiales bacterium]
MEQSKELILSNEFDTIKLNKFFFKKYPLLSLSNLQKLVRTGQIRVNSKRIKFNHTLNKGDKVRIPPFLTSLKEDMVSKVAIPKELQNQLLESVIYQDNDIIVINKPAGISSQGGINIRLPLDRILKAALKKDVYMVHRLDKDTSGVMVFAINPKSARTLTGYFKNREVEKIYIAKTSCIPSPFKGEIKLPLSSDKEKMVVDEKNGKSAITDYKVIKRFKNNTALVQVKPLTGRKHQIRAHLSCGLNCPIIGDKLYGKDSSLKEDKNLLHLFAYQIIIPGYGTFKAPYPTWINIK